MLEVGSLKQFVEVDYLMWQSNGNGAFDARSLDLNLEVLGSQSKF
jgi:hypothetical protein